ncbi:MAG: hypothetical protein ACL93V_02945 [Candidatus Electrothrix sp. YB6]
MKKKRRNKRNRSNKTRQTKRPVTRVNNIKKKKSIISKLSKILPIIGIAAAFSAPFMTNYIKYNGKPELYIDRKYSPKGILPFEHLSTYENGVKKDILITSFRIKNKSFFFPGFIDNVSISQINSTNKKTDFKLLDINKKEISRPLCTIFPFIDNEGRDIEIRFQVIAPFIDDIKERPKFQIQLFDNTKHQVVAIQSVIVTSKTKYPSKETLEEWKLQNKTIK